MKPISFNKLKKLVNESFERCRYILTLTTSKVYNGTISGYKKDNYWDDEKYIRFTIGDADSVIRTLGAKFVDVAEEIANLEPGVYAVYVNEYPHGSISRIEKIKNDIYIR